MSTSGSSPGPRSKSCSGNRKIRVRTSEQLERKRHNDRLNHKARREKDKSLLDRLQAEVESLRSELAVLRRQADASSLFSPNPQPQEPCFTPLIARYAECPGQSDHDDQASQGSTPPSTQRRAPDLVYVLAAGSSMMSMDHTINSSQSALFGGGWPLLLLFCKCGFEHNSKSECMEHVSHTLLSGSCPDSILPSSSSSKGCLALAPTLPKNFDSSHIICPVADDNFLIASLVKVFDQLNFQSFDIYFGLLLLIYRRLRYHLQTDAQSREDVPSWFHSAGIQATAPHLICIDYLPWPSLRHYMISNQQSIIENNSQSVYMYTAGLRLSWPKDKPFLIPSESSSLVVSSEFEECIMSLDSWSMSQEWACLYPDLAPLANVDTSTDTWCDNMGYQGIMASPQENWQAHGAHLWSKWSS